MEATVTIEQFWKLLQSDQDNALLRLVRQLQNVEQLAGGPISGPETTQIFWTGWT